MVSARTLISTSYSPCIKLLLTVPSAPITIGITVTFMFHIFFSSLAKFKYLLFFSLSFNFSLWSAETAKSPTRQFLFLFFFFLVSLGLVVWSTSGDPFVSRNSRANSASHSPREILGCAFTICSYGQISISCTIPCGSRFPPSHV